MPKKVWFLAVRIQLTLLRSKLVNPRWLFILKPLSVPIKTLFPFVAMVLMLFDRSPFLVVKVVNLFPLNRINPLLEANHI